MKFLIHFEHIGQVPSIHDFALAGEQVLINAGYAKGDLALPFFSGTAIIVDSRIASVITSYEKNGETWVPLCYTDPEFRGQGFCRELLDSLAERCSSPLFWGANVRNQPAVDFYDKFATRDFILYRYEGKIRAQHSNQA
jgi:GNAT superfamily N-acetyltransferase